jgi:hypothetical protein
VALSVDIRHDRGRRITAMKPSCTALLFALFAGTGMAQTAPAGRAEPEVKRTVLEDDAVRIEELRVRGQVQRILVTPKVAGARPYDIVPADASRDSSQHRGLAGQSLWHVFSF